MKKLLMSLILLVGCCSQPPETKFFEATVIKSESFGYGGNRGQYIEDSDGNRFAVRDYKFLLVVGDRVKVKQVGSKIEVIELLK